MMRPHRMKPTMTISKAVLLAAGRGTRMESLTDDCPKPMLPLQGRPLLAHQIERLEEAGVRRILVVTGYKAEIVEQYFDLHPAAVAEIHFQVQAQQDGTGSAAALARNFVGQDPFLLTYGDILVEPKVYESLFERLEDAEAALTVKDIDDPYRGAAVYVDDDKVMRIIEKPPRGSSTTRWVNAGVYCFRPSVFDELDRIRLSPRGEYELTDAVIQMLRKGVKFGWLPIDGFWKDVGRPEDLREAAEFVDGNSA
jgi:dTDP-glucose pyrophosphorylase